MNREKAGNIKNGVLDDIDGKKKLHINIPKIKCMRQTCLGKIPFAKRSDRILQDVGNTFKNGETVPPTSKKQDQKIKEKFRKARKRSSTLRETSENEKIFVQEGQAQKCSQATGRVDFNFSKFRNENDYEEDKLSLSKEDPRSKSRLSTARIDPSAKNQAKKDHSIAMDYLSLIQDLQRKRRFTEISNEIKQQQNMGDPDLTSRQDSQHLNFVKTHGFSGKFHNNTGHLGRGSIETEESQSNNTSEYELGAMLETTTKRFKSLEVASDPELDREVDMEEARRKRDEMRLNSNFE